MSEWGIVEDIREKAVIKVIGVGGGGGNAVQHMVNSKIEGAEFICLNTDKQALEKMQATSKIVLGKEVTGGLGAGTDPMKGREAALEDKDRIKEIIKGADMLFITAGMGGGTGTGAAPVIAQISKELEILTVAVVTKPFELEGTRRMDTALEGINELVEEVDSLITIPNQKLLEVFGQDCPMLEAFKHANDVLSGAVRGISDIIIRPGLINVDFADVKTVMSERGTAMMGTGIGSGPDRARLAAEQAIASKLLEEVSLQDAKGVLVNITAGPDLTQGEFQSVLDCIEVFAAKEATIVTGTVVDESIGNDLVVTVIATGLGNSCSRRISTASNQTTISQISTNSFNDNKSLSLSSASREILEKPPLEKRESKGPEEKESHEDDYLDIPSFIRTQID